MSHLMIILNAEEAAQVRGPTKPGHALDPVPLADGVTFVLPVRVLEDPAHEIHHAFLSTLPQREVEDSEFYQPGEDTE